MSKKKLIISFKKLSPALQEQVQQKYPGELIDHARKIPKGNNDFFYGIDFETDDTSYLVKIEVNFDKTLDESRMEKLLSDEEGARESQRMFYRSGFAGKSERN